MKKSALSLVLAATLIGSLAACSTTPLPEATEAAYTAPGPEALADAKGVTEITIWHGLGAANGAAFTKLIDEFNAANADTIHVTSTYQGVYADLLAKYTAGLRSETVPTVLLAGDVATGFLVDVNKSIPAEEMAAANPDDLKIDELAPAATNYYTVNGKLQAIPMNVSTPMLWINRDLFAQAGLSEDIDLSTIDAVVKAAKTIAQKTGQKGFTMPDDDWYIEQLTSTVGQSFCTPDNGRNGDPATGISINDGDAKDAISSVAELYRDGVAVAGAPDGSAALSAFQAGKVGMMLYSSGVFGSLKTSTIDYEALPFPTDGGKDSGVLIGGSALWTSATATPAQQVAGWKLATFLTSAAAQEEFTHATGYVPIKNAVATSATQIDYLKANPIYQSFIDQVENTPTSTATAGCVTGAMTAIRAGNMNQLSAAYAGTKSVEEALEAAADDATAAIESYQKQVGN